MLKKLFAGIAIGFFLSLTAVYLFIPAQTTVNETVLIPTAEVNAFKFLTNKQQWRRWWPGISTTTAGDFVYGENLYRINKLTNSGAAVSITGSKVNMQSKVVFFAEAKESIKVTWAGTAYLGLNPIKRIGNYFAAKQTTKDISVILSHLKSFLADDAQVYGIPIKLSQVKDSAVMASKLITNHYPATSEVYEMVNTLTAQIKQQNGLIMGPPMLNVHQTGPAVFEVMVALPVNKPLKATNNMVINKMVLGNILETKVTGGINTINAAAQQLKLYVKDYNLISPAMPYEQLVTNRIAEPDTTKWITKLYYPIF